MACLKILLVDHAPLDENDFKVPACLLARVASVVYGERPNIGPPIPRPEGRQIEFQNLGHRRSILSADAKGQNHIATATPGLGRGNYCQHSRFEPQMIADLQSDLLGETDHRHRLVFKMHRQQADAHRV